MTFSANETGARQACWTRLVLLDPANGQKIASYDWKTDYNENIADPVVVGDKIFISSDYGRGCALLSLEADQAKVVWENTNLLSYFASPVLVGDCIYGFTVSGWMKDDLACVSMKDGSIKWPSAWFGCADSTQTEYSGGSHDLLGEIGVEVGLLDSNHFRMHQFTAPMMTIPKMKSG